ncbi:hypothetical protein QYF36_024816 [Acer negundo]|nr:hypothetical protein QYF36_024816 [Acer negundo]
MPLLKLKSTNFLQVYDAKLDIQDDVVLMLSSLEDGDGNEDEWGWWNGAVDENARDVMKSMEKWDVDENEWGMKSLAEGLVVDKWKWC